jgi:hypothetical protein
MQQQQEFLAAVGTRDTINSSVASNFAIALMKSCLTDHSRLCKKNPTEEEPRDFKLE